MASDANGNFVVVWQGSSGQDGSFYGVFGQRFHAFGLPLESEFQINSYTTGYQFFPAVASAANGNFVAVWQSDGQDGSALGVFGQRFNASGVPQGGNFRANTRVAFSQYAPAVSSAANGNVVVVWVSSAQGGSQDGDGEGIFGQRYGDLIFQNGFE